MATFSQWLKEELLPYLAEWDKSVAGRTGFSDKEKAMMVLTHETRLGIRITGKCTGFTLYAIHQGI